MVKFKQFSDMVGKVVCKRNSFSYSCVEVRGDYALIVGKAYDNTPRSFEVWKLRYFPANNNLGMGGFVKFPSNEDFGSYGWSFSLGSQALARFKLLTGDL